MNPSPSAPQAPAVVAGRSAAAAVQAIIDQQRVDAASQTEWDSQAEEEEPWEEGLPVFAW